MSLDANTNEVAGVPATENGIAPRVYAQRCYRILKGGEKRYYQSTRKYVPKTDVRKVSDEIKAGIKADAASGMKRTEIAKKYNICGSTVTRYAK